MNHIKINRSFRGKAGGSRLDESVLKRISDLSKCLNASLALFSLMCWMVAPVRAQTIVQSVAIKAGWNAVFLEVEPLAANPDTIFAGSPVETVAAILIPVSSMQYIQDPSKIGWNSEGWGIWRAPGRADAFLNTLFAIRGFKPYLVFSKSDALIRIEGKPCYQRFAWKPDTYNFTGFGLDPQNAPTFGSFFAASPAHAGQSIFRLQDGKWKLVANPAATPMQAGEAFWIYCKGSSPYQGPLELGMPPLNELDFGSQGSRLSVGLINLSPAPCSVRIAPISGTATLPLLNVIKDLAQLKTTYAPLNDPALLLVPGMDKNSAFTLAPARDRMILRRQSAILEITTSFGSRFVLPASASRSDLAPQP